ncbi:hypothetical protein KIN20_015172 [Parelaphostrongylus tenuis]|uniref:Uncharacterized protein n=1 Tax=Parelaphostrongylus tenuis TaxID=148309 RepID=A0AAD5MEI1_PARTN|nr:hypothetical protein KIN20_015172 [Parelaphostrongylus tenuis]
MGKRVSAALAPSSTRAGLRIRIQLTAHIGRVRMGKCGTIPVLRLYAGFAFTPSYDKDEPVFDNCRMH